MDKLDIFKTSWIKTTLNNDELSDEEMLEYLIAEGNLSRKEAEKWVSLREFYLGTESLLHRYVVLIKRKTKCPYCGGDLLKILLLHKKGWLLECTKCEDVLSKKDQLTFAMKPTWRAADNRPLYNRGKALELFRSTPLFSLPRLDKYWNEIPR